MGKSLASLHKGRDHTPVHPHAAALVWHPYLLDNAVEVSKVLNRQHQSTTPEQALSVLLRSLEGPDD